MLLLGCKKSEDLGDINKMLPPHVSETREIRIMTRKMFKKG